MEYTFISNCPPYPATDDMLGPLDGPRKAKDIDESHQWLFFRNSHWTPFDVHNQAKLFETLLMNGTFVDIKDSHFPGVERLRVFPASNYVSYLGTRYKLSHILLPRLTYSV